MFPTKSFSVRKRPNTLGFVFTNNFEKPNAVPVENENIQNAYLAPKSEYSEQAVDSVNEATKMSPEQAVDLVNEVTKMSPEPQVIVDDKVISGINKLTKKSSRIKFNHKLNGSRVRLL